MADDPILGIDVSHHNGTINWAKVKLSSPGISFAYIKATQGVDFKDPALVTNVAGATNAGIKFGFYHFASLNDNLNVTKDATDEATWFVSVIRTFPGATIMPALDIETNDKQLTTQQVQVWINAFLSRMKELGHEHIMLYSFKPFFDDNLPANHKFGTLPLWLAQYRNVSAPSVPRGWTKQMIWQYTDKGVVSGIAGNCDMNKADPDFLLLPV